MIIHDQILPEYIVRNKSSDIYYNLTFQPYSNRTRFSIVIIMMMLWFPFSSEVDFASWIALVLDREPLIYAMTIDN